MIGAAAVGSGSMIFAGLPLAAIGDWTSVIIWAVVIGIGILNQLFGGDKKKPPQVGPRQPNGGGGGNVAPGQKPLLDEVERFLQDARKATAQAHNRPAQQQQRPQQQRPQQQVGRSLPSQQQPQRQQKQPGGKRKNQQQGGDRQREQQPQRLSQSELSRLRPEVDQLEEVRFAGSVGQHVAEHLGTSRFDERAGRLSHLQQTVDSDIGSHVHSVFDHKIGSLTSGSAAATTSNDTPTGPNQMVELVAMLKDPMSMRNAVLMREILEPPTHRW